MNRIVLKKIRNKTLSGNRPGICHGLMLMLMLMLTASCENGIVGTGGKPDPEPPRQGFAQKGPFAIGSNIEIVIRPGPDYLETGTTQRQTLDSIGNFEFEFETDTVYDITITGRHFNEITGLLSDEPMPLKNTYYQGKESRPFVSINILTHLIHSRINHLITVDKLLPAAATTQASQELLDSFQNDLFAGHLKNFSFSNMAVYNLDESDNDSNAVLLFISAAFYKQSELFQNSSTMEEMLAAIADDLEVDGKIDSSTMQSSESSATVAVISSLDFAARFLDPDKLVANLTALRSTDGSGAVSVPDISFLLDNDADGITNDIDDDDDGDGIKDVTDNKPCEFEIITGLQTFNTTRNASVPVTLQFNVPEDSANNKIYQRISIPPVNGVLSGEYPNLVYTPTQEFVGSDSFNYEITCSLPCRAVPGNIYTSVGTVTIIVSGG